MQKHFVLIHVVLVVLVSQFGYANSEKRVALVLGNSAYQYAGTLANPLNDANDMARSLEDLGFEVVLGIDQNYNSMRNTLREFSARLDGADVALFFYAGHAVQVNGINYLAPIDTDIEREADLEFETVPLDVVQKLMEREAKTQLVFLDACRNNPLTRQLLRRTRSVETGTGLAREAVSAEGSYIAFATQPGNVALDGTGRNSPFTSALLKNLKRPGVEISALMTDVRRDVYESTGKQQLPWTNSGLLGHFYFAPADENNIQNSTETNPVKHKDISEFEREKAKWDAIKETNSPLVIKKFMAEFPNGVLTSLAQFKLDQIEIATKQKDKLRQQNEKIKQLEQQQLAKLQTEEKEKAEEGPKPVTAEIVRSIQENLNRVGCNAGKPDGKWGKNSIRALSDYNRYSKTNFATADPSHQLYDYLRYRDQRVCPLDCGVRYVEKNNQCVLKTCSSGYRLNSNGTCVKQTVRKKSGTNRKSVRNKSSNKRKVAKKTTRSSNCFEFNGKTVCE